MKLKWIEKKYSVDETTFVMYCLGIIAGCGIFTAIIGTLLYVIGWGKTIRPILSGKFCRRMLRCFLY